MSLVAPSPVGLSDAEAARRLATDGPNELPTAKKRNLLQQAWGVIREPMLLLLLGAGAIAFLLVASFGSLPFPGQDSHQQPSGPGNHR